MLPIPPISALRALEAVVRLRGFSRAAEDLQVTQSSISQHIRLLEDWTGRRLLNRGARVTEPTAEGLRLAQVVEAGLGMIGEVCAELRSQKAAERPLTVSTLPGFAHNWLFPRLIRFDQMHPDIPVSISTNQEPVDFRSGNEDIAIRYGLGGYRHLHFEKLMGERIFPVCAPELVRRGPPLNEIADLARHTILIDEVLPLRGKAPNWLAWLRHCGHGELKLRRTRRFGQSNMVVQAAVEGLGIALGREPLVIDALKAGRLVRPFKEVTVSDFSYWIVCPEEALQNPRLQAFRTWLLEEAASMPALPLPVAPGATAAGALPSLDAKGAGRS
ncbi:LysR substrate-binding domain-containing protein [Geminicoccaceae bacterium 1502E]|nr:LysR substrate-binding domain-containing protein [Geminicoccaceae bacterium 1502E]